MRQQRIFLLTAVLIFSGLLLAQVPNVAPTKKALTGETSNKNFLKIPVWVEQEENTFWKEGKLRSFKVFLDGKETSIKSFQAPNSSSIILIVFDTVSDLARVDDARIALQEQFKELSSQYWIGLLKVQDGLSVLQEPTPDRGLLNEKIQEIQVNGKAGLLDSLELISQMATAIMQKAAVRLSVLYVTDSGVGNYRADYMNPVINSSDSGDLSRRFSDRAIQERMSRLSQDLNQYTIPLYFLHLNHRGDTLNLAYQSGLESLAVRSGGQAVFCRTRDEISSALNSLMSRLLAGYILAVDHPNTKRNVVKVQIEAKSEDGTSLPRLTYTSQIYLRKNKR